MTTSSSNLVNFDAVEGFEDFFRFYQELPGVFKYRAIIHDLYANPKKGIIGVVLYVTFEDVADYDPRLSNELMILPESTLEYAVEAMKNLLRIEAGGTIDETLEYHVRLATSTEAPSFHVQLRSLLKSNLDKLVHVRGIVVKMGPPKPQVITATYECQDCGHQFDVAQFDVTLLKPAKCLNPACSNRVKFILVTKDSTFIDWQVLTVQESPDELPPGLIPRSTRIIVTHELVDKVRPGDRVAVIGTYRGVPEEINRAKSTLFKTFVQAIAIESREGESDVVEITEDEESQILEMAKTPSIQMKIARSIVPNIMGFDYLKLAVALSLFGGVRKRKKNKNDFIRGDIHVLFIGDPGTGKSQIIRAAIGYSSRGLYTSGKGSSAAGLTAAVMKDKDGGGGMSLEAGALVLTDGGCCGIDEFDKMRPDDRNAIHEALEQQTVSIAKAGIVATLNCRTSVMAAANPYLGRYNPWKTPAENIHLSPPVLSRFDLIFVIIDTPDKARDEQIEDFIYDLHQKLGSETPDEVGPINEEFFEPGILKKYITYARRNCHPRLPPRRPRTDDDADKDVAQRIKDFYNKYRGGSDNQAIGATWRNYEGIIRLCESHAKMALKEYVEISDVECVLKLITRYMQDVGADPETGQVDFDRLVTGIGRSERLRLDKVMDTLKDMLEESAGRAIDQEALVNRLTLEGEDQGALEEAIVRLKKEGNIYSPHAGTLKIGGNGSR